MSNRRDILPRMTVTIRPAEPRDTKALGRMGAMLMRTHYAFDPKRFLEAEPGTEQGYASFLGSMMRHGGVFVATQDDDVVGYVWAAMEPLSWKELRGPAGFIHDILVEERARGAGIGTLLLKAAIEWLRDQGAPRVVLWTAAQNTGAQKLFSQKFGFRNTMVEMTMELE